jgi:hypothetical protein
MGSDAFDRARASGSSMDTSQAVELALGAPPAA